MTDKRFDSKKLAKLNNPNRLLDVPVGFVFDQVQPQDTEVMVDLGAGTAFYSIAFLNHVSCDTLYACDVSQTMLDWIEENVVEQYPAIQPVKTDGNAIPLATGIASVVFMLNLYHELDDHHSILTEAYRVLKPGGKVVVIDWKKEEMAEGPPMDIRFFVHDVEEEVSEAGFISIGATSELKKHFIVFGTKQ